MTSVAVARAENILRPLVIGCAYRRHFDVKAPVGFNEQEVLHCAFAELPLREAGTPQLCRARRSTLDPSIFTLERAPAGVGQEN